MVKICIVWYKNLDHKLIFFKGSNYGEFIFHSAGLSRQQAMNKFINTLLSLTILPTIPLNLPTIGSFSDQQFPNLWHMDGGEGGGLLF